MSEKDERIKVMNEVLGGMKVHVLWKCNLLEITSIFMYNVVVKN